MILLNLFYKINIFCIEISFFIFQSVSRLAGWAFMPPTGYRVSFLVDYRRHSASSLSHLDEKTKQKNQDWQPYHPPITYVFLLLSAIAATSPMIDQSFPLPSYQVMARPFLSFIQHLIILKNINALTRIELIYF